MEKLFGVSFRIRRAQHSLQIPTTQQTSVQTIQGDMASDIERDR